MKDLNIQESIWVNPQSLKFSGSFGTEQLTWNRGSQLVNSLGWFYKILKEHPIFYFSVDYRREIGEFHPKDWWGMDNTLFAVEFYYSSDLQRFVDGTFYLSFKANRSASPVGTVYWAIQAKLNRGPWGTKLLATLTDTSIEETLSLPKDDVRPGWNLVSFHISEIGGSPDVINFRRAVFYWR